ncbi:kynureninase [Mucilaginibacter frigoritolerans]|jgi:kynureninase|uniref:Kynureninase n=1 Tax=Mucilaginibacter frigoritolerans TaxID=652788 RepID=A0A562U4Y5_9SPHI|nr:kynureninase [Mucilaginibacter frigoritolerans]TWJ00882.1 kynureninase [Mucilaginibacter frigoritolerans]
MNYQNTLAFATALDEQDELKDLKKLFLVPQNKGKDVIYFCGNSLGLQPVTAQQYVLDQFANWKNLGIEGFFEGDDPWLGYHKKLTGILANLLGAKKDEVTIMNSLTVNLHLLMVSFYKPTSKRYKIIMEGGAFPSDQYAFASQARFHGYDPKEAIIEIFPREGESILRTEDILKTINNHADDLALVLFGGVNYFTGQFYDIEAITKTAHKVGAFAGFDLAHAAGNVLLNLHDWDVDFAAWCSYKYMNSGPGGISGIFVNEKHFNNQSLNRFEGWWGYREDKRFLMTHDFEPEIGAAGWQLSTSPVMLLTLHKAALDIFQQAGGLEPLRAKSQLLTGYLEFLIEQINQNKGEDVLRIITPKNKDERGCQLSIVCKNNARKTFDFLTSHSVIGDWREPNVIRLSPVPLYNSFKQVFDVAGILAASLGEN